MSGTVEQVVREVCERFGRDRTRMMDIVREVQRALGHVPNQAVEAIAAAVGTPRVEVDSVVSFYAFYSDETTGTIVIRLCDDIIDRMAGYDEVRAAFEEELGIELGGRPTPDGRSRSSVRRASACATRRRRRMVNDVVVTEPLERQGAAHRPRAAGARGPEPARQALRRRQQRAPAGAGDGGEQRAHARVRVVFSPR
jgi:NADH:ubiquinone oxidoreductase subunit E